MEFSDYDVEFLVDESLRNYEEIVAWFYRLNSNKRVTEEFSDFTFFIMSGQKNVRRQLTFFNAHPIALGQLTFSEEDEEPMPITCNVTLAYSHFMFTDHLAISVPNPYNS